MRLRTLLVIVTAIVLQAALAPHLRLLGATPAVLLAVAVAAGIVGHAERAALIGFAAGFGMDLLVQSPFGLWSLTGTLLAWAVAQLHGRAIAPGLVARLVTAAVGTAVGIGLFVVLGGLLGERHLIGLPLGGLTLALVAYNVAIVPMAVRALKWSLGPDATVRPVTVDR